MVRRFFRSLEVAALLATLAVNARSPVAVAQTTNLGLGSDILDELAGGKKSQDVLGLRHSHLSMVETWKGVEPLRSKPGTPKQTYAWKAGKGFVSPLGPPAISTLIEVPIAGDYRLFVRHQLTVKEEMPLTLTVESLPSGKPQTHVFGKLRLLDNENGREQERRLPIRVESEVQLNTFADSQMFVWEYWDLKLAKGPHRVSLSAGTKAKVEAVFLSQSKDFRPSFSTVKKDNTLHPVYVRFRLKPAGQAMPQYSLTAGLTYHWRGRSAPGSTEPLWGYPVGTLAKVPTAEWSPFIDAAEAVLPGPGPWSTCRVSFKGVSVGTAEVQFAWHPHEVAVQHTMQTAIGDGAIMFRVPHGSPFLRGDGDEPVWGVWDRAYTAQVLPEEAIVEKYFTWAEEAADKLKLSPDHPKPTHLRLLTSCRVGLAHRQRAAEMLARLGVNWLPGTPREIAEKLDLYIDEPITKVKMGDEIGTYTLPAVVNGDGAMLAGFHDYLRDQAKLQGVDAGELFGASDVTQLRCLGELPENPGRFERRLFYHSHRYCHLATIDGYARGLRAIEKKFPEAHVYNNYSPHPVFLTGRNMNGSDWFLLPRAGAQTLGWAEDWATGGSWGLGTPSAQCTSFFAALVDCAVRKRGYPAGFYVGTNCGYSAQKMFGCVAQGITTLHLYDWGPIDGWAEGSNAWSELQSQYESVMIGAHALGPADEIVAKGQREPRRVAILYNRSHEIVSGNVVTLDHDWMWTFIGLKSSQIPVDVIIEEDLNADDLKRYEVLYLGGMNLEKRHLAVVRKWVEQGGLVVGSAGSAMFDAYGDRIAETVELFGAEQRLAGADEHGLSAETQFAASEWFPATKLTPGANGGRLHVLTPKTAKSLAAYAGGSCAATVNAVGKGHALLIGFNFGETFRTGGKALGTARNWLAAPALHRLGRQRVEFDYPESEATLFEHATGLAVLVANFTPDRTNLSATPTRLSVQTARPIKQVTSALRGPLQWKQAGDRIEIEMTSPAELVVDAVILKE